MRTHKATLGPALRATSRLLSYTSCATAAGRWFSYRLSLVREKKKPRAVLQRAIEFYALVSREAARFPSADVEHLGLAKTILAMTRGDTRVYPKGFYRKRYWLAAGRYMSMELAAHAITFVRNHLAEQVAPLLEQPQ
jgi:hypothetical protein